MRRRGVRPGVGLVLSVLAGALVLHVSAQSPGFTITDFVGQQGPADPLPASWALNPPFALSPSSLFRRADGRIHVTARAQNLSLDLPANYASQPNTSVTRLNPFGGPEELLEPMVTVEGACWERAGTCDYVVDAATCTVVERDQGTGALQRMTGGACQSGTPDGQSRLNARYGFVTAVGYQPSLGLLLGTCTFSSSAIYRIQPGVNLVERIAGTGVPGYDADNVPATTARIDCPRGIIETAYVPGNPGATDGIVFAEFNNNIVRRVNTSGIISTVAGDRAFSGPGNGDGGPATSARLFSPVCVTPDGGEYYICESGSIRRVNVATGVITTEVGGGQVGSPWGVARDTFGNLFVGDLGASRVGVVPTGGSYQLAMGTPLGVPPILSFNGDGRPGNEASLGPVSDVAFFPDDGTGARVVIADPLDHRVRFYDEDTGVVTTFAGTGVPPTFINEIGDGGPAAEARLWEPSGVAVAEDESVYITERLGCRIRRVDTSGIITTVAGTGICTANPADAGPGPTTPLAQPFDIEVSAAGGTLYWTEIGSHLVRRMSQGGNVERVAGTGVAGYSGDGGPASAAQLSQPRGLSLSLTASIVYVADTNNHRVRSIDLTASPPVISRLAGTGTPGFGGDAGPALNAQLHAPWDTVLWGDYLLVSDSENHRIREVGLSNAPTQNIGTIAGNGQRGRGGRGGTATDARLSSPRGLSPFLGFLETAFVESGSRRVSRLVRASGPSVPGAPPGLNGSVDGNLVDLDWQDASGDPTGYTVNARATPGGPLIASLPVGPNRHVSVPAPNGTYVVTVYASNAQGNGPESSPVTIVVPGTLSPPAAPQNLAASVTDRTVRFSWQVNGLTPGLYSMLAAAVPDGPPIAAIRFGGFQFGAPALDAPSAAVRTFTVSDVPPGTYYVRLHAENRAGLSPPSNEVVVSVAVPPPPGPPILNAAEVNGRRVRLSWAPAGTGGTASSYVVTASLSSGGPTIASLPVAATSLEVDAPPGTYFVRVRALGGGGASAPSNEIEVTVP